MNRSGLTAPAQSGLARQRTGTIADLEDDRARAAYAWRWLREEFRVEDDARYFQISVPVQPGNSGGALVDERGNVVGVVSAKLSASATLKASGTLPENVNYAIKSSYLLSFLESVPEVSAKLKEPNAQERKFEDVVKDAEQAAVLVLVY